MTIIANSSEAYHASEGVSKTGLWKLWTKTPFHFRYGERKEESHFDLGDADHAAVLEPERFEQMFWRGPDDRRGNKWKEAGDYCDAHGMTLLTSGDYDLALALRDTATTCMPLQSMLSGERVIEQSAYNVDEETCVTVRCRSDIYSVTHNLILDLKTSADASKSAFQKSIANFGYHVQEALYSEVWEGAGGGAVDGFFFVVIEKSNPPVIAVYELDRPAVEEGYAIYRQALRKYAECEAAGVWPGYPDEVQTIGLKRWDYRVTEAPEGE